MPMTWSNTDSKSEKLSVFNFELVWTGTMPVQANAVEQAKEREILLSVPADDTDYKTRNSEVEGSRHALLWSPSIHSSHV